MEQLGKYQLHEKLGEGGFGRVWKALDTDLEVWRALKEPFDQSAEMEIQLKEARVQAKLDHPGMVRVLGTERLDGRFFLVTEFVEGQTLRAWMANHGRLEKEQVDELLLAVLEALCYAHGHGVVHLDLKPENIFMTPDGSAKIGDFGLARVVDRPLVTMTTVQGTIHYMAPEQLDGKAGPSVDLWAVGAIAYELYAGRFAIAGETQGQILKRVAIGEVQDLEPVPEDRRVWVASLLCPDPAQRPSAETALQQLRAACGLDEPWSRESVTAPPRRWGQSALVALAVSLVALLGVAGGLWAGIFDGPRGDRVWAWLEAEPESLRPPETFYALEAPAQLDQAWQFADAGAYPLAYGAVGAVLNRGEPRLAEALYLRALLAAQHLGAPWHAVVDIERYLEQSPDGPQAMAARLLLAELYGGLGRTRRGIETLDTALSRHPGHPLLGDALALANQWQAQLAREQGSDGWRRTLLPNNRMSLVLTVASLCMLLVPVPVLARGRAAAGGNRKLYLVLGAGFLVFQGVQIYLNRHSAGSLQGELVQALEMLRVSLGGQ